MHTKPRWFLWTSTPRILRLILNTLLSEGEHLEDIEVSAPAFLSSDSESEHPTKVTSKKHCIFAHFQNDRNYEVYLRTKMTRNPYSRRTDEEKPRAEKFGDWDQRSKVVSIQTGKKDEKKKSYLLLLLDCRPILVSVRLVHRYCRTHQVVLHVQQTCEVTKTCREVNAISSKSKKKGKEGQQRDSGKSLTRSPDTNRGVHRTSWRYKSVCFRTHFSWLRFGTDYKSNIQEVSYLYALAKDPNYGVCFGIKMTRTPCKRRTDEAGRRAEKFEVLITSDHKVFNEEDESRNNHRYAVVLQDMVTKWIQSYLRTTKTSQLTERTLRKFSRVVGNFESQ